MLFQKISYNHTVSENITEVSAKNTKDQILAAYNQAMEKLKAKHNEPANVAVVKKQNEAVVEEATKIASRSIIEEFSQFKNRLVKDIDALVSDLNHELQTLQTVRQAINIERQTLEELYRIRQGANTLEALLSAQRTEQDLFVENMDLQKIEWQKKLLQLESDFKEKREFLEKNRKREEEEYAYNTELKRRKEQNEYLAEKSILEKEMENKKQELAKREQTVTQQEQLFLELQEKVAKFDQELHKQIMRAESDIKTKLEKEHQFDMELADREAKAKEKLYEQKIIYLETKIAEQEQLIKQLTIKADEASSQVQAIACRALDASSKRFGIANQREEN